MGNSLDRIGQGFYICGLDALKDVERLKEVGITHILNAASMELYSGNPGLRQLQKLFTVKALECRDSEDCNLSIHFHDLADFIQNGREQGSVVVHCAAGISRASTSACAYLMIKEHLSLEAALQKVHSVRKIVHPNSGFWRQLRDLEGVLQLQGVTLQPLDPQTVHEAAAPRESINDEDRLGDPAVMMAMAGQDPDFPSLLAELDGSIAGTQPFTSHFLHARLVLEEGSNPADLVDRIRESQAPGVVWQEVGLQGDVVCARAKVAPFMDATAFKALLERQGGVQDVTCA
jgi:predicted protein tyrosine phosphatase